MKKTKKAGGRKSVSLSLPAETVRLLEIGAARESRTLSNYAGLLVVAALASKEKEAA
jgi:hypothetical protein